MKVALSVWEGRISPVFDCARRLLVLDVSEGKTDGERTEVLLEELPCRKVIKLRELGVEVLVCGAISRPLADSIASSGVGVFAFIAGEVNDVFDAYLSGSLSGPPFLMPGCFGKKWSFQTGRHGMDPGDG